MRYLVTRRQNMQTVYRCRYVDRSFGWTSHKSFAHPYSSRNGALRAAKKTGWPCEVVEDKGVVV